MKKFLLVLGAVFALTACGGGGEEPAPADEAPVDEAPAEDAAGEGEEAAGDFDAEAARTTYEASCIGCHGGNLEGGVGPALAGTELSAEEIEHVILNGQGTMPAQNLPEEDANNIAQWIKTQ
ncbi:c-type cytochrome [Halalkalibacter oceani]|uniref:C-type cytochrome n=1 Tax=Halalkalibacter oceani TaxID=1653776 RepID=A0A9X2IQJ8_9BACI|nr:c-type cytochrome [Halalkalibacter oceani]MCM3714638.1 c-type cytochrome [Halalkalibacter oceani]